MERYRNYDLEIYNIRDLIERFEIERRFSRYIVYK